MYSIRPSDLFLILFIVASIFFTILTALVIITVRSLCLHRLQRLIDVAGLNAPNTAEEMFHSLDLVTPVDAPNFEIRLVLMSRNALIAVRSEDCILILMSELALLLALLVGDCFEHSVCSCH